MEEQEKTTGEMEEKDEAAAKKKGKDMTIKIMADQVMHSGISVSKDGYKSARMLIKIDDKEYMSISYEWEGEGIPDFVMSLMSFIQASKEEIEKSKTEKAEEYKEYSNRVYGEEEAEDDAGSE